MLKVIETSNLDEKWSRLQEVDLHQSTWLVSDLQSKSEIQKRWLTKFDCLPEDSVLRVSELWQKLFHRHFTDFELVSTSLVSTYLTEWLKQKDLSWAKHSGTARTLIEYIGFFLPIISKSENLPTTVEWLRGQSSIFLRWGNWLQLSYEAWQMLVRDKTIARPWAAAYLASAEIRKWAWGRKLIFDLGPDLSLIEVDLIQQLAKNFDVTVIAPTKAVQDKHQTVLWPYAHLTNQSVTQKNSKNTEVNVPGEYLRLSSPLAEIKAATQFCREALESGFQPSEIGLFAAKIEDYWPVLEPYLRSEGVPFEKDVVFTAASLPSVSRWLAQLRVESRQLSTGDLEQILYSSKAEAPLIYEKFAALYRQVYEASDLDRDQSVSRRFSKKFKKFEKIDRDAYLFWALQFWEGDLLGVEKIVAALLQECPLRLSLEVTSWVRYTEALSTKIEMSASSERSRGGIYCGNFDSAAHLSLKRVYLFGLSEAQLSEQKRVAVSLTDILKINSDLGIRLPEISVQSGEYWVEAIANQNEHCAFSFSATNMSGDPVSPSQFWLSGAKQALADVESCQAPKFTRWDEIQSQPFENGVAGELKTLVDVDCGREAAPLAKINSHISYSPSQIENYLQCPFKFTAAKLLRLSDFADVDLDIDALTQGRLMHACADRLLEGDILVKGVETNQLSQIVDEERAKLGIVIAVEELWPKQREIYVNLLAKFIEFEMNWRNSFKSTKTVGREIKVSGTMKLDGETEIQVSGRIDRIDAGPENQLVVIDYKMKSNSKQRNYKSWLKNDELQLLFYSLALEEGLTSINKGPVVGAFYYTFANLDREKGFRQQTEVGRLFSASRSNELDRTVLDDLYSQLKFKVAGVVKRIRNGELSAQPKKVEECRTCNWKTLCRAPHLN